MADNLYVGSTYALMFIRRYPWITEVTDVETQHNLLTQTFYQSVHLLWCVQHTRWCSPDVINLWLKWRKVFLWDSAHNHTHDNTIVCKDPWSERRVLKHQPMADNMLLSWISPCHCPTTWALPLWQLNSSLLGALLSCTTSLCGSKFMCVLAWLWLKAGRTQVMCKLASAFLIAFKQKDSFPFRLR